MLNNVLNKIKSVIRPEETSFRKFKSDALDKSSDADVRKIINILTFMATDGGWSREEEEAFKKVSSIKAAYLNSNQKVVIKDFGAGAKNSIRSEDQTDKGVEREVVISDVCRSAATREKWGKFMFKIVRDFKFDHCLELGTNLGVSAAYQLSAMKLNNKGRLVTLEGAEAYAKLADESLKSLQYDNYAVRVGRFSDTLPAVLAQEQPIDFAFIDGHHDETATKNYFEQIYPFLSPKAVLIFDDISWSQGMKNAWQSIYQDKKVKASIDLNKWGICLIDKESPTEALAYYKLSV